MHLFFLKNNPLICEESLYWLFETSWINVTDSGETICNGPPCLLGYHLNDLPVNGKYSITTTVEDLMASINKPLFAC